MSRDSSLAENSLDKIKTHELAQFQLKMMKHHMLQMTQNRIEKAKKIPREVLEKRRKRAIKEVISELEIARVLRKSTKQRFQTTSSRLIDFLKQVKI